MVMIIAITASVKASTRAWFVSDSYRLASCIKFSGDKSVLSINNFIVNSCQAFNAMAALAAVAVVASPAKPFSSRSALAASAWAMLARSF